MKSTFEIIGGAAKKASADLLLIGGYALQVYGYARQTLDVDCLVVSSDANSLRELLCLETYAPIAETGNFIRFQSDSVYLMDIDILLVDRSTMQAMLAESKPCRLQGVDFRTPSLLHLIALKLHAIANNPKRLNRLKHLFAAAVVDQPVMDYCSFHLLK